MKTLIGFIRRLISGLRFRLLLLVVFTCTPLVALMLHTAGEERRRAMVNWRQKEQTLQQAARRQEQQEERETSSQKPLARGRHSSASFFSSARSVSASIVPRF